MAIEVTVRKSQPRLVAFVSKKGPYSQIAETFGQLYGWIGQKGYTPVGPPMGVYFNAPGQVPEAELLWELRAPIGGDAEPAGPDEGGVGVRQLEEAEIAATMHKGPFDQVGPAWEALAAWIAENGYDVAGPPEEAYLSDPEKTAPEELLTELRFPVRKR